MIESQDHDSAEQELKEEQDRQAYSEDMESAEYEICEAFKHANLLGVEVDDLITIIQKAFYESQDMRIGIVKKDFNAMSFEDQIKEIEEIWK